jgi:hypothetical protein
MDASKIARDAMPAVGAAIGAYGTAALTRDRDEHAEQPQELGRIVLQTIYWRAKNVPQLESAVTDSAAAPKDEDALSALRLQITKALAADEVLLQQAEKLITGGAPALAAAEKEEQETKAQAGTGGA